MWTCQCGNRVGDPFYECPNCGRLRPVAEPERPDDRGLGNLLLTIGQFACVIGCLWTVVVFFIGFGSLGTPNGSGPGAGLLIVSSILSFVLFAALYVTFGRVKKIA